MKVKKFDAFEDKPPIFYREGTSDEAIIRANIIDRNEYLFPKLSPKIVYDIGGNTGIIAVIMAQIYPDAIIHSFEPMEENYELLEKNVAEYPNIKPHWFGLGESDHKRMFWPSADPINHGGFSMEIKSDKPQVECRMRSTWEVCEEFGAPEVIKIDVEGAEYEIFEAMPDWALTGCKWITGELHGIKDFLLLDKLSEHFKINVRKDFDALVYHFHAANKTWTSASGQNK